MTNEVNNRKIQIFVVEDNLGDLELLRMALRAAEIDFELTVIQDGGEALDFVQQRGKYAHAPAPDLAVLDLNLPRNDGLEVLEAMRANQTFAAVPVAVLSSSSSPGEREKVQRFHVGRFIVKPTDLDQYLKIGSILGQLLSENRSGGVSSRA